MGYVSIYVPLQYNTLNVIHSLKLLFNNLKISLSNFFLHSFLFCPHFTKEETEALSILPKHTVSGISEPQIQPHPCFSPHGSSLCLCCICNQDVQTRVDSEPADKAFSHLSSFPGQVQRKTEEGDIRSCWDQPCAPWPQGPECEADGTQTLIQDSHCPVWLFWHFIWIYLFILLKIHLCSQVGNKSTQTESFSRDVLPPSDRGWERE